MTKHSPITRTTARAEWTPEQWADFARDRSRVDPRTGCWHWLRSFNSAGQPVAWGGEYYANGGGRIVSLLAKLKGVLPKDHKRDHTCGHPDCVNPEHVGAAPIVHRNGRSK